ncbi:hypothetical protein BSL78_29607 [Apostichopus japonicus]|uniref:Uncharacterized protein n=1 Tax=Stichopus japonicus TaxID=307972 RepID=A0A2G8JCV5_STIJA|nr:hypothetical protein BSL78_29607 [Apostichopus japonicus]
MDRSCSSAICDPGWVAPLPTSQDHHLIKVQISTRGGYHGIQSSQFIIHVDGYWREFESGDSPLTTISESMNSRHIQDHLRSLKPTIVYYLSPLTSPMFLLSDERGLIFSSNDFKDNIFLQVTATTVTRVCEEDARFVVSLPDRILYGDSYAAFEIFGNFAVVSQQSMDFIPINEVSCIKAIIIPPHSYLVEWFIYLIGSDGLATDKIYQAIIHTDEPLEFLAVTDGADSGACEFIKGANTGVWQTKCLVSFRCELLCDWWSSQCDNTKSKLSSCWRWVPLNVTLTLEAVTLFYS